MKKRKSLLQLDISIGRVPLVQKAVFAKHLAVMLKSGLLINEALAIAEESARGKMKRVIEDVKKSVESGNTLSSSLGKHPKIFSGLFVDVARAGEESGTLAQNLGNIANQLEKEANLKSKIKSAMAYPVVVLVAAFIMALAMAYYVLPQITPLFTGLNIELPVTTRIVIWFSNVVQQYGDKLFLGIILFILAAAWTVRQKFSYPVTHGLFLRVPLLKKISMNSNLARFSLTLGTLLKSGLVIDEALDITTRTVSNFYYRRAIGRAAKKIQKGGGLAPNLILEQSLFPRLVSSMVHVGEQSGTLDETLLYLADFYEREVDSSTKAFTIALEPMLLIVVGVVVATLALSIITPIYEITGNIGR